MTKGKTHLNAKIRLKMVDLEDQYYAGTDLHKISLCFELNIQIKLSEIVFFNVEGCVTCQQNLPSENRFFNVCIALSCTREGKI